MATYVALVNELLRRINETTLDTAGDGFGDARNLQAIAKDAINSSTREILQTSQEWPFLITTYTETLSVGTGTYAWQTDVSKIDWDSFYLKRLTSENNEPKKLTVLTYVDYLRHHRPNDDTSGTGGYTTPQYIYKTEEGTTREIHPLLAVKSFVQQVPLTYYRVNTNQDIESDVYIS